VYRHIDDDSTVSTILVADDQTLLIGDGDKLSHWDSSQESQPLVVMSFANEGLQMLCTFLQEEIENVRYQSHEIDEIRDEIEQCTLNKKRSSVRTIMMNKSTSSTWSCKKRLRRSKTRQTRIIQMMPTTNQTRSTTNLTVLIVCRNLALGSRTIMHWRGLIANTSSKQEWKICPMMRASLTITHSTEK
jgi:hypothetical protein